MLPVEVRRKLGIVGGSKLELEVAGSEIILKSLCKESVSPEDCTGLVKNTVGPVSVTRMDEMLGQAFQKESGR